ncbi:uncharacterized protein CTRU02_213678 [Colletotrichum truncatum]|uniref:Uncharacterized protein n=1 Tax=Colletotrichum truncatum TaxID=5467 RepID=A0ACC3YGG4_COLTU|nr:uncharacterized protein CTRU02_11748 [Colletotrichum truncatum]KAF6785448.1 hypothetical protein CTRU02_11748 [Colletotrichum truncatum]
MIIILNDHPREAITPSDCPVLTMAPNPLCLAWREQIMDNLRLVSGRSAFIDIYTARHPNKTYTIYAVKVHRGKRQEVLSATGRDLEDAYETLHTKSAQEVYQFVELNGFGFPRGTKPEDSDCSDSDGASTLDASEVLSLSTVSSDSENDNIVSHRDKKTKKSHRKSKKKSKRHVSSSEEDSASDTDDAPQRRRPIAIARPSYIPGPPIPGSQVPPPPPPPGWRGPPVRVGYPRALGQGPPPPLPPPGRFQPGMRMTQGIALPPAPGPVSVPAPPPPTGPAKPVRLDLSWAGHGEKKIVENCHPSHRALQRTALAYIRANWQSFENVLPQDMTSSRLWSLTARVRRVEFGKDMYAISAAAGDDLTMYFKADDIPKFEIEIDHDPSVVVPPPPPPPPPHPHVQH